jgi:hypothetical protein
MRWQLDTWPTIWLIAAIAFTLALRFVSPNSRARRVGAGGIALCLVLWIGSLLMPQGVVEVAMPWDMPPSSISWNGHDYGQEAGTPDPRERPCLDFSEVKGKMVELEFPAPSDFEYVGDVISIFGGVPVYHASPGNLLLVESTPDCYWTYPPWI